jgi:hypothetical protein
MPALHCIPIYKASQRLHVNQESLRFATFLLRWAVPGEIVIWEPVEDKLTGPVVCVSDRTLILATQRYNFPCGAQRVPGDVARGERAVPH